MRRPRLGFLGTGWVGRHRMEAILQDSHAEAVAISDPSPSMASRSGTNAAPGARR